MSTRTLIIRSSEWSRGNADNYYMRNVDGFCCLGLDARDCGVSVEVMKYITYPEKLPSDERKKVPQWTSNEEVINLAYICAKINDEETTTDEEKISLLIPIFKSVGVQIEWRPEE